MATDIGEKTPDFTLPSDSWENKASLEKTRQEGPVVPFFYPGDWSNVCTDEMGQQQQQIGRFEEKGARVVGLSVNSPWPHKAWAEERGIGFPLPSDCGREMLEEYGVKHEADFLERAYLVTDQQDVVRAKRSRTHPGTSRRLRR